MAKYYELDEEEIHLGFIYYREDDPYGHKSKSEVTRDWSWRHYEKYSEEFFGKFLDREDIEGELNRIENETGKKWKHGRQAVKGDAPMTHPWEEFVLEDASSIIFNDYLHKVLIEKTFPNGRGSAVVFNGEVKNLSEFRRILKQIGV